MPNVPAFCNNCNNIFSSGIFAENSSNVTLTGCQSQCPRCGHMGQIPDGVFNFIGDTIEILKAPERTIEQYKKLEQIARKAINNRLPLESIHSELEESIPELSSSLKGLLPKSRSDLYGFLQVIIAIIALFMSSGSKESVTTNNVINYVYQDNITKNSNVHSNNFQLTNINTPFVAPTKTGRNDPCPCGSEKKFKNCCGEDTSVTTSVYTE